MNTIPTIGIEIELPWHTMLRRVDGEAADILVNASQGFYRLPEPEKARVQQGFDTVDQVYKELVDSSFGPEVVRKVDGYAEFAFRPKEHYVDISEQVRELYEKGVFIDGESYPLHVTLGGIAAKRSSWLVLMAAELSGGTSPERITQVNTWSQKGVAGVKERHPAELELDATVGIELRTLQARSADGLAHTLAVVQTAGAVLLESLNGNLLAAEKWHELRETMLTAALEQGVDATMRWRNPQHDRNPWQALGLALSDEVWACGVQSKIDAILLD